MADEMHAEIVFPTCRPKGCCMQCLGGKLLHAILAEEREPQSGGLGNCGCRESLGDGHQLDLCALAASSSASRRNRFFQPFEIFG